MKMRNPTRLMPRLLEFVGEAKIELRLITKVPDCLLSSSIQKVLYFSFYVPLPALSRFMCTLIVVFFFSVFCYKFDRCGKYFNERKEK